MLPTFVIGLREGLEASLIVGIIAAFLMKQGRDDLVRWLFAGVAAAVVLCVGVGVALDAVSRELPQRQQEGLETVIGVLAVGMVTYMVVWMRRHSRELKGQLEGLAAEAMSTPGGNAARAMVIMAFLAVLREGFETVVFLLAAFNEAQSRATAGTGAFLGILVAAGLGYGIYRGGVRINLARFFRVTGIVLVLVAAGLVVSAIHTAHEAGWYTFGQSRVVDLTRLPVIGWLLHAGSVQASLLTGMLGIQPRPALIEVIGWMLYLIPVGCYVAGPAGRRVPHRRAARVALAGGVAALVVSLVLGITAPAGPARQPITGAGTRSAQLLGGDFSPVVRTQPQSPADASRVVGRSQSDVRVRAGGQVRHLGLVTDIFTANVAGSGTRGLPATLPLPQVAALGGGRLPIGVRSIGVTRLPVRYRDIDALEVWVIPVTGRIIDLRWTESVNVSVVAAGVGSIPLAEPIRRATSSWPVATTASARVRAVRDADAIAARSVRSTQIALLLAAALLALAFAAGSAVADRRIPEPSVEPVAARIPSPV